MDSNHLERVLDKLDDMSKDIGEIKQSLTEQKERISTQAYLNKELRAHMIETKSHIDNVRGAGKLLAMLITVLTIFSLSFGLFK